MIPSSTIFARFGFLKTIEEKNINIKPAKINQKDPISNMIPNKDTCGVPEERAESKKAMIIPRPETRSHDFGKTIFPSRNLAMDQKITQRVSPTTSSNPLEVSTGILVKGKKKTGNKTMTKNSEKKESLLNIFEFMNLIVLYID